MGQVKVRARSWDEAHATLARRIGKGKTIVRLLVVRGPKGRDQTKSTYVATVRPKKQAGRRRKVV